MNFVDELNCKLQLGGSDQWGNITAGTDLIRRINGNNAYGLTCPLITKADGGKFGKTESGNIWLDARYTSPEDFFKFWLNVNYMDACRYIKIFTTLTQDDIKVLETKHAEDKSSKAMQIRLAKEVTKMVHGEDVCNTISESLII